MSRQIGFNTPNDIKTPPEFNEIENNYLARMAVVSNHYDPLIKNAQGYFEQIKMQYDLSRNDEELRDQYYAARAELAGVNSGKQRALLQQRKLAFIEEIIKSNNLERVSYSLVQYISENLHRPTDKKIKLDKSVCQDLITDYKYSKNKMPQPETEYQLALWELFKTEFQYLKEDQDMRYVVLKQIKTNEEMERLDQQLSKKTDEPTKKKVTKV